jgi:D-alanine-D-alanine ligase
LPKKLEIEVQSAAERAFKVVDCAGFARVDFLVSNDDYVCLEVNTIPGMTAEYGLVPKAALARGIQPRELVQKLLECALRDHAIFDRTH